MLMVSSHFVVLQVLESTYFDYFFLFFYLRKGLTNQIPESVPESFPESSFPFFKAQDSSTDSSMYIEL